MTRLFYYPYFYDIDRVLVNDPARELYLVDESAAVMAACRTDNAVRRSMNVRLLRRLIHNSENYATAKGFGCCLDVEFPDNKTAEVSLHTSVLGHPTYIPAFYIDLTMEPDAFLLRLHEALQDNVLNKADELIGGVCQAYCAELFGSFSNKELRELRTLKDCKTMRKSESVRKGKMTHCFFALDNIKTLMGRGFGSSGSYSLGDLTPEMLHQIVLSADPFLVLDDPIYEEIKNLRTHNYHSELATFAEIWIACVDEILSWEESRAEIIFQGDPNFVSPDEERCFQYYSERLENRPLWKGLKGDSVVKKLKTVPFSDEKQWQNFRSREIETRLVRQNSEELFGDLDAPKYMDEFGRQKNLFQMLYENGARMEDNKVAVLKNMLAYAQEHSGKSTLKETENICAGKLKKVNSSKPLSLREIAESISAYERFRYSVWHKNSLVGASLSYAGAPEKPEETCPKGYGLEQRIARANFDFSAGSRAHSTLRESGPKRRSQYTPLR